MTGMFATTILEWKAAHPVMRFTIKALCLVILVSPVALVLTAKPVPVHVSADRLGTSKGTDPDGFMWITSPAPKGWIDPGVRQEQQQDADMCNFMGQDVCQNLRRAIADTNDSRNGMSAELRTLRRIERLLQESRKWP